MPDSAQLEQRRAIGISFAIAVLMLAGKCAAAWITGSAAILSDAAESVIHIIAVGFAAFSVWLAEQPPSEKSPYGYERIAFFSAGFEGGMIIVAALWIIVEATKKWIAGLSFESLGLGALAVLIASLVNLALGWYLVRVGRRTGSRILEANGEHVLTDSWTSFGVVAGLLLVIATDWKPFDPLLAIAVALNILWTGGKLIRSSIRGLMDLPDPERADRIRTAVEALAAERGVDYHRLRMRDTGHRMLVSVHLLFPGDRPIGEVHRLATDWENELANRLDFRIEVFSHLESLDDHEQLHPDESRPIRHHPVGSSHPPAAGTL